MKTNDLIAAMAADLPNRPVPPGQALLRGLLISVPIAFGLLVAALHVRPDLANALLSVRFDFKLVFTGLLAASGFWLTNRLARPGAVSRPALTAVGLVMVALAVAVGIELMVLPRETWMPHMVGSMSWQCVSQIPLLAIGPLAAMLLALRQGAPTNTTAAGAAAGLIAGGIGAFFYATTCPNDSPLFVAVWYLIGISSVVVLGALVGRFALKW